jgi:hypothetical protein
MSTYIRNSTGFLYQIIGETSARRAQNSGSLRSFFFRAREVRTKPPILTRSNSSMEMMCHGDHSRNHWHVALLTTEFAGTFIDPFRNTTSAQSSREPESTVRATQQSAVVKIEGVRSQLLLTKAAAKCQQDSPRFSGRRAERAPEPTGANIQDSPRINRVRARTHKHHTLRRQQQLGTNLLPQTAQQLPTRHRHSRVNVNPTSGRCSCSHHGTSSHSHTLAHDAFSCLCSGSYVGKVLIRFDQSCKGVNVDITIAPSATTAIVAPPATLPPQHQRFYNAP